MGLQRNFKPLEPEDLEINVDVYLDKLQLEKTLAAQRS